MKRQITHHLLAALIGVAFTAELQARITRFTKLLSFDVTGGFTPITHTNRNG